MAKNVVDIKITYITQVKQRKQSWSGIFHLLQIFGSAQWESNHFFPQKVEFTIIVVYNMEWWSRFVGGPKVYISKVLLYATIKATHSFIHHFPISLSFHPCLFYLSWTRVRWRCTLTANIRGLCGMAAGNSCGVRSGRKGWSHDPAGHWPRFRHCCTSAILSPVLTLWLALTAASLGRTTRIMHNWVE